MSDQHVTKVEQRGKKFVLACCCGWVSGEKDTRSSARAAGQVHRINAAVQSL